MYVRCGGRLIPQHECRSEGNSNELVLSSTFMQMRRPDSLVGLYDKLSHLTGLILDVKVPYASGVSKYLA